MSNHIIFATLPIVMNEWDAMIDTTLTQIVVFVIMIPVFFILLGTLVRHFILNANWNKKTIPAVFLGCQYYVTRVEVSGRERQGIPSNNAIGKERYVMEFLNEETGDKMRFIVDDTVGREWAKDKIQQRMPYLATEDNFGMKNESEQKGLLTYSGTKFIAFQKNS